MDHKRKLTLQDMKGEIKTYFNWSANVLIPFHPGAADVYLTKNRSPILKIAQLLLKHIHYDPGHIYRGIILKEPVKKITPHENLQYLSFSANRSVAEHFADINGFGSDILDVAAHLGHYGYIIEYTPRITEVLFHYRFLSILPYVEAFSLLGMNGISQVEALRKQEEITIIQPSEPFSNITNPTIKNGE